MSAFSDLPEVIGRPDLRWVGTALMDEEQFRVEGWHLERGEWRADLDGLNRYAQLSRERKARRIAAARARDERDDEFRDYVDSLREGR